MNAILSLITIAAPLLGVVIYGQPGFIVGAGVALAAFFINWRTGGFDEMLHRRSGNDPLKGNRELIHRSQLIVGMYPEECRERIDESDVDRVSCMDVVRMIRQRVGKFSRSKGMVVVLLEGCRVQIYFFDGISRTSWGYNNHQFSTDRVGETFLVGPPTEIALTVNTEHLLPDLIKREFASCDISVGPLWKLDPTSWDYEAMKALHGGDVGIRISFDSLAKRRG